MYISVKEAAKIAKVSRSTISIWCTRFNIGEFIEPHWNVNAEKLKQLLDGKILDAVKIVRKGTVHHRFGKKHTVTTISKIKESVKTYFKKNINYKGENNPNSKLTEAQVAQVKYLLNHSNLNYQEISSQYGVHKDTIRKINTRITWRWVQEADSCAIKEEEKAENAS